MTLAIHNNDVRLISQTPNQATLSSLRLKRSLLCKDVIHVEYPIAQGSLQLGGHGGPPNHFEIPPNQKVTKFICFLYIIIRVMWLAPKVILSNQVDNKILVIITKPSKMLERTLEIYK